MYHRVEDLAYDPYDLAVSPKNFMQQIDYIKRTCSVVSLLDIAKGLRSGSLPRRAVAITFDDGYVDNLKNAKPILKAAQTPATA